MSELQPLPEDLVKPEEIREYLKERTVTPEASLGIRLLKRAAEMIEYQQSRLVVQSDVIRSKQHLLEDVVNALGADFHEKYPDPEHSVHDVLAFIEDLYVQMNGLQQGIIERDRIIENYERTSPVPVEPFNPVSVAWNDDEPKDSVCAEGNTLGSTGYSLTEDQEKWISSAKKFAYKVYGAMLALESTNPALRDLREDADVLMIEKPFK